jgi:hypothetical protein
MNGPYFQTQSWPAFVYQGQTYEFAHLNEYEIEANDSEKQTRRIAISFSDHCFTRQPEAGDDPMLRYLQSSRSPGYFCTDRYRLSLDLVQHIERATQRNVWNIRDGNFAIVPVVLHQGVKVLYGIVFSLDRVKGLPVDLHMRVETAYPCDEKDIVTFGSVRFALLVTLRMQGRNPKRILDKHRKRPRLI